jgi:hypothetical protein
MGELTAGQAGLILEAVRKVNAGLATPEAVRADLATALARLQASPAEGG